MKSLLGRDMITIRDAKANLSRLVAALERDGGEVIITRNGKPAARLIPFAASPQTVRIGVARGRFQTPEPDAACEAEAAELFLRSGMQ